MPAFVVPQFEQVWSRTDQPVLSGAVSRSWIWGPSLPGNVRSEPFAGAPGGTRTVQYFDKARMEVNSAVTDTTNPWSTTTGLLVVELVSGRVQVGASAYETRPPANVPVAGDGDTSSGIAPLYSSFRDVASLPSGSPHRMAASTGSVVTATIDKEGKVAALTNSDVRYTDYSQETGHNIPDVFSRFMHTSDLVSEAGSLRQAQLLDPVYVFGYPITEAYWTTVPVNGKPTQVLVQLFQRRVLTYIPSFDKAWQVQMGNVGQHYYQWRYSAPATPAPTATPDSPSTNDTFLRISGSQFTYRNSPVLLKGTNYWMHMYPAGASTWSEWDAPVVRQELQKAHDLGVNTLRVLLPYEEEVVWGAGCSVPRVRCEQIKGPILNRLTQLLQIASGYNMKVLVTLFDLSNSFPQLGTPDYSRQLTYLQAIVAPLASDDRVLGWDLHNEPEHYDAWQANTAGPPVVISWLANIAAAVKSLDPHHPITVGVANYSTLGSTPAASMCSTSLTLPRFIPTARAP